MNPARFISVLWGMVLAVVPLSAAAYTDTEGSAFESAIEALTDYGLISGYEDGSFYPNRSINRAEFVKILVAAMDLDLARGGCFEDVTDEWFAPFVCAAAESEWVSGYEDGTFLPANSVTLVEAVKVLANAFSVSVSEGEGDFWFSPFLETLVNQGVVPSSLDYYVEPVNRGEAAEMVWRLLNGTSSEDVASLASIQAGECLDSSETMISDVDLERVRDTWFDWTNQARASAGLPAYVHESQLDRTALIWSEISRDRGYMNHKRDGTTAYYDYWAIRDWFASLGVEFSGSGTTFVENIGHGPYSCEDVDCTDELIEAIYYTFDYFMSEAGSSYRPHYDSIMSSTYDFIGFGIVVTESEYYLTVHYGTELTTEVVPYCDE